MIKMLLLVIVTNRGTKTLSSSAGRLFFVIIHRALLSA